MKKAKFKTKMKNYLQGVASVLNIFPSAKKNHYFKDDQKALCSDAKIVSRDFQVAFNKIKK